MELMRLVLPLFILINLGFREADAEVLKTINVAMPTNYGTFLGEIHYAEKDLAVALRVERVVKEDLIKVINYFEYVPHDVVHFNIDPYMRLTNGNARIFPTNIINLFNFPASNREHLIVMENWMQGLVLHEFVHITHLDQTRDYLQLGRSIFGTIAKVPAGIVPRWFTEGIAVWGESHLINEGRLHNPLFNKELLLAFKDKNFCKTIDCLDDPGVFPNGELAYWAGAHFMEYLENEKPKTIKCLAEENSHALPFTLNRAFENCTGEDAASKYAKFRQSYMASSDENESWGEKVNNVFGTDDYQKGVILDGDRVYKVEHHKKSEALLFYDLKDQVNFMAQYKQPIADLVSMVNVDNENRMLLVAFNDDPNFRKYNRVWKLVNADTLLVERTLDFKHDPSYVISLGGENYITVSYWENHWIVEQNGDVLRSFPNEYNVSFARKVGDQLLFKMNNANGVTSLILTDLRLKNLNVVYKSEKPFDLPVINDKYLVVREGSNLKLIEWEKTLQISNLPKERLNQITFWEKNDERTLSLEDGLKTKALTAKESESFIKKDKSGTQTIAPEELSLMSSPSHSFASDKAENFPRLDHLIPHYWFLATGSSNNLFSIGAMTTLVDPMEVHTLDAVALAYTSARKVGGSLDYNYKAVPLSDQLNFNAYFDQEYDKTNFNPKINLTRDITAKVTYNVLMKRWTYTPGLYFGRSTAEDFISNRTIDNFGFSQGLVFQALTFDDFFQYLTAGVNLQSNKTSAKSYFVTQMITDLGVRFNEQFSASAKATFGKLHKTDFTNGVIYGGGVSDFTRKRIHEFYGLPYSNAFGNEIRTTRLMLDYKFWDIYRGHDLFPFFLREAHLLAGHQSLYADRIFLDGRTYKEKTITGLFIGPRLKVDLFYYVPANIDIIFSTIAAPNGKNVNQGEVTFTADLF